MAWIHLRYSCSIKVSLMVVSYALTQTSSYCKNVRESLPMRAEVGVVVPAVAQWVEIQLQRLGLLWRLRFDPWVTQCVQGSGTAAAAAQVAAMAQI